MYRRNMLSNSWLPFNIWWQLIIFMLIITKKSSMIQTGTDKSSKTKSSIFKYFNNDLSNIKHNDLEELKIWLMLQQPLRYTDYDDTNNNAERPWSSLQELLDKSFEGIYYKNYGNHNFIKDVMVNNNNNASQLNNLMNYLKNANILNAINDQVLNDEYNTDAFISNENDNKKRTEKRAWNKFKYVWVKRDKKNSSWNNFRNAWGKRETRNWNNLKGLWGKRNTNNTKIWLKPSLHWNKYLQSASNELQLF